MKPYPLQWPAGYVRTKYPMTSRFDTTFDKARKNLMIELDRLGASEAILSTNIPLRLDGQPYGTMRPDNNDNGVAVYFKIDGNPRVITCDYWDRVCDNMQAVAKTVEAMRGIDRWKCTQMRERMFSGFVELAERSELDPYAILGIARTATPDEIKAAYRRKTVETHPDRNQGKSDSYELVQRAYKELTKAL